MLETACFAISMRGRPLVEIETWIFDLDNTLYPSSCRLFDQIHARMTRFIADRLGLSPEAALAVQKSYFREHRTTMRRWLSPVIWAAFAVPMSFSATVHILSSEYINCQRGCA